MTTTQPPLGVPGTTAVRVENESATCPVQGPGTSDVLATQPLLVPGAGTSTQSSQAPGAGPEVLPSGCEATLFDQSLSGGRNTEVAGESESEAELDGEPASPASIHDQSDLPETTTDQDLSEDANYRETIRGVRSFMGWHHIPHYTGSPLHWPGSKLEISKLVRKVVAKPQISPKRRPRDLRSINDNYCVSNVVGVRNSVHVSDKMEDLNPSQVTSKSETVILHVNFFVANVHSVQGCHKRKL